MRGMDIRCEQIFLRLFLEVQVNSIMLQAGEKRDYNCLCIGYVQ